MEAYHILLGHVVNCHESGVVTCLRVFGAGVAETDEKPFDRGNGLSRRSVRRDPPEKVEYIIHFSGCIWCVCTARRRAAET